MSKEVKLLPEENEQTEDINEPEVPRKKRRSKKTDLYIELVLFFILGLLIGITLKTEADKRVTIGYNDYQMNIKKSDYDINKLQVDLAKKAAQGNTASQQNPPNSAQNQGSSADQNQSDGIIPAPDQNSQN